MLHTPHAIGLISNPLSQRNKALPGKLRDAAESAGSVAFASLDRMDALDGIIDGFGQKGVEVLAIDGGDGTVQAALTALFSRRAAGRDGGRPLPHLCILPGGMTNLIAGDVGAPGRRADALRRLTRIVGNGRIARHTVTRHVIRVRYGDGASCRYGMFFGAGAVPPAIMMCRRVVHPMNVKGSGAVALTVMGLLLRHGLFDRSEGNVFRGRNMRLAWDGGQARNGQQLLLLASTLDRLALGTRPFWGAGSDGVKITAIAWPARRLIRSLPALLFGGSTRRLDPGTFTSITTSRAELHLDEPFTLDGEMYTPQPGTPVVLEDAGTVSFVTW